MKTENIQQKFKKKFVRTDKLSGEYRLGWLLKEGVTGNDVLDFIKDIVVPAVISDMMVEEKATIDDYLYDKGFNQNSALQKKQGEEIIKKINKE